MSRIHFYKSPMDGEFVPSVVVYGFLIAVGFLLSVILVSESVWWVPGIFVVLFFFNIIAYNLSPWREIDSRIVVAIDSLNTLSKQDRDRFPKDTYSKLTDSDISLDGRRQLAGKVIDAVNVIKHKQAMIGTGKLNETLGGVQDIINTTEDEIKTYKEFA